VTAGVEWSGAAPLKKHEGLVADRRELGRPIGNRPQDAILPHDEFTFAYSWGRAKAMYSPEYGPPLTATTTYCLPLSR
jgi:hypothetical protein